MHTIGHDGDPTVTNLAWWDERASHHVRSDFYDVQRVIDGEIRLNPYEIEEVGDVTGKALVHLQCHLGTETIGWARLGANATGLDFSSEVVENARRLADDSGVDIEYVQGDVYDAPSLLGQNRFDIAYVNIGSLHWLPDINRWGDTVAQLLKPGGMVYINEIHPISSVLAENEPTFERDYFYDGPVLWDEDGSYADVGGSTTHNQHVIYDRPLSDIMTALTDAGLVVTGFREWAGQEYQQFPDQVRGEDGRWYTPGQARFPSMFSLKAVLLDRPMGPGQTDEATD